MSNHAHRRPRVVRPTRGEVDVFVRASAQLLGCTCTEVDVAMRHGHSLVDVGHDPGCPAEHAGRRHAALIVRGHRR